MDDAVALLGGPEAVQPPLPDHLVDSWALEAVVAAAGEGRPESQEVSGWVGE